MRLMMLSAAALFGSGLAAPALARSNPEPPPSGIVIHLFGQNSIMSNMLPTAPTPASGAAANDAAVAGTPAPAYVEPTTHDILHQMFVTGDPNNPPKPAPGRTAERPGS